MRKFAAVLFLGALAGVASANFTESFDTGPTGWADGTANTFGNTSGGDAMAFSSGSWYALNNSTNVGFTGWFDNSSQIFPPHSGPGQAGANFLGANGAGLIDELLESPVLTLNNGDTISFWSRVPDPPVTFPDRLLLKLSTSGSATSAASFSTTLLTINSGLTTSGYPSVYTQFTATISGLSGATSGRFAFDYNIPNGGPSGNQGSFVGIDDVSYVAATTPEPATVAALGLGLLAIVSRKKRKG